MSHLRSTASAVTAFVAATWLLVAVSYLPWTFAIGQKVLQGTSFTVDKWTLVTPYVIVLCAPVSAVMVWRGLSLAGAILLAIISANWVLWEWFSAGFAGVRNGNWPALFLFLLSLLTGGALVLQSRLRAQGRFEEAT